MSTTVDLHSFNKSLVLGQYNGDVTSSSFFRAIKENETKFVSFMTSAFPNVVYELVQDTQLLNTDKYILSMEMRNILSSVTYDEDEIDFLL